MRGYKGGRGDTTSSEDSRDRANYSRDKSHSVGHRGELLGPLICNHCNKPGHKADRCYSNPNSPLYKGVQSSAKVSNRQRRQ